MTIKSGGKDAEGALTRSRLTLGHDIRSAMSDVIGGLRLVDMATLDDGNSRHLERARTAAELLARLLDDAAVVFLGETSDPEERRAPVSVPELLDDVAARWSDRAQEKGLDFHLSSAEGLPRFTAPDRLSIDRILSNLLGNAIKFCDQGQVTLEATCDDKGRLCIAISDTGPGFSRQALKMLFKYEGRPYQNDKPGSGFGLYIAKEIADRLGSELDVRNRPQGGAVVTLRLPPPGLSVPSGPGQSPVDLSGLEVLVCDDNVTNQFLLRNMLQSLGATCTLASDGPEAFRLCKSRRFDLVFMDIEMPGMTGIEVIRLIRRAETGARTRLPIVAVTAYGLSANREAIMASGADDVVSKPVLSVDQLSAASARVLQRRSDPRPAPVASALSTLDPATRAEIVGHLRADLLDIAEGLKSARRRSDRALVQKHCHVLVALAGTIENAPLQKVTRALLDLSKRQDWTRLEAQIRTVEQQVGIALGSPLFADDAPGPVT